MLHNIQQFLKDRGAGAQDDATRPATPLNERLFIVALFVVSAVLILAWASLLAYGAYRFVAWLLLTE
jgi:hypothetical protein